MGVSQELLKAAENINTKAGRDIVVDYYSPEFGFEKSPEETNKMIEILIIQRNVLALGTGALVEVWLLQNRHRLKECLFLVLALQSI